MAEYAEVPDSEKTPVTLVTGFLGSGKTTLINYILKEQTDWKICVVENEFGEVAIDGDLVEENLAAKEVRQYSYQSILRILCIQYWISSPYFCNPPHPSKILFFSWLF